MAASDPSLSKTPLAETGCLGNPYFTHWLPKHPDFLIHPSLLHSQLGYLWLPTLHYAASVWLTGYYATPLVTRCFPPNPYLGKQRISLGMIDILSMCPAHIPNLLIICSDLWKICSSWDLNSLHDRVAY